jgi:hypothetical protein
MTTTNATLIHLQWTLPAYTQFPLLTCQNLHTEKCGSDPVRYTPVQECCTICRKWDMVTLRWVWGNVMIKSTYGDSNKQSVTQLQNIFYCNICNDKTKLDFSPNKSTTFKNTITSNATVTGQDKTGHNLYTDYVPLNLWQFTHYEKKTVVLQDTQLNRTITGSSWKETHTRMGKHVNRAEGWFDWNERMWVQELCVMPHLQTQQIVMCSTVLQCDSHFCYNTCNSTNGLPAAPPPPPPKPLRIY